MYRVCIVEVICCWGIVAKSGLLINACTNSFMWSRSSLEVNGLKRTITSRLVSAMSGSPMLYTSVSGLSTNFFSPAEFKTCNQIRESDSSALHVSLLSDWGGKLHSVNIAWFCSDPVNPPAVTNLCPGKSLCLTCSIKYCDKKTNETSLTLPAA